MGKKIDKLAEYCHYVSTIARDGIVLTDNEEDEKLINAHLEGIGRFAFLIENIIKDEKIDEVCDKHGAFITMRAVLTAFCDRIQEDEDAD